MEKFLVASDIHGSGEALERLSTLMAKHNLDSMLVCGDLEPDRIDPSLLSLADMTLVKGNCDSSYGFQAVGRPLPPLVVRIPWNGRTIVMTHGDRWPTPYGLSMQKDDIFIFGHIHVPRLYTDSDGVVILNPGSTTYPRGGSPASYAILSPTEIEIRSLVQDKPLQRLTIASLSAR